MSDKSFGDYSNRNVAKNPLLSNAVTGLSIEDLTHNTFLLPAVRNQGLISSQDEMPDIIESNTQNSDFQSGDTKSNTHTITSDFNRSPITTVTQSVPLTPNANSIPSLEPTVTTVKPKTEDDFDVNEYFARLQGTRYVSAPKNCPLDEDQNANLQANEESLEEINLNDSQNSDNAVHSITADIAQNFSQLPQVLPQVASAVFSSFSNMLSLKSREQTPEFDSNKTQTYDGLDIQYESNIPTETAPDIGSANYNIAENIIAAPSPPKEPPRFASTSSYRITAKKKTYAPIPGLSTGEVCASNLLGPTFQIPKPELPIFFDPSLQNNSNTTEFKLTELADYNKKIPTQHQYSQIDLAEAKVTLNTASFVSQPESIKIYQPPQNNTEFLQSTVNLSEPVLSSVTKNQPPGQILPPPPMFSNVLMKNDGNQTSISRTVLPPSVARRISSNQQIKTTVIPCETAFLIPQMPQENLNQNKSVELKLNESTNPSVIDSVAPPTSNLLTTFINPLTHDSNVKSTLSQPKSITPSQAELSNITGISNNELGISLQIASNPAETFCNPLALKAKPDAKESDAGKDIGNKSCEKSNSNTYYQITNLATEVPKLFGNNTLQKKNDRDEPPCINPITFKHEEKSQQISLKNASTISSQTDPPKTINEPPKLSPNQTYRLVKKKPQYYSGPIEGIGSVSNNVKPVLPLFQQSTSTISSYQGTLFTPNQSTVPESTPLYSADENSQLTQPAIENQSVFDINRSVINETINVQSYSPIDINKSFTSSQNQPNNEYSMAFDMSQATTDTYNTTKQESAAYGLLGSLKSKLGTIDINKIQNSVTTFFDPGYNVKNNKENNMPHNQYSHESNLEIFVPNEQYDMISQPPEFQNKNVYDNCPIATKPYDNYIHCSSDSTDTQNTSGTVTEGNFSNVTQSNDSITQMQEEKKNARSNNIETPHVNIFTLPPTQNQESPENIQLKSLYLEQSNISPFPSKPQKKDENNDISSSFFKIPYTQDTDVLICSDFSKSDSLAPETFFPIPSFKTEDLQAREASITGNNTINKNLNNSSKDFFPYSFFQTHLNLNNKNKNSPSNIFTASSQNDLNKKVPDTYSDVSYFSVPSLDATKIPSDISFSKETSLKSPEEFFEVPNLQQQDLDHVKNNALMLPSMNISTTTLDNSQHSLLLNNPTANLLINKTEKQYRQTHTDNKDCFDIYDNKYLNVNFESLVIDDKLQEDLAILSDNELNICETCREVNKPEEKDVDDLTRHLIENITAPIQLRNPVEAPLPDVEPIPDIPSDFANLENKQIGESSMFTENSNIENYTPVSDSYSWDPQKPQLDESSNLMLDDINAYINANPDSIVTYHENNTFYYNNQPYIPTNASDEIKAEFSISESVLQCHALNLPDIDDQNILDVHQIEQDAKNDFHVCGNYLIEPFETDDDKIEFRERKHSSEDESQEIDSFTNRVDKYKKMEKSSNYLELCNDDDSECDDIINDYEILNIPIFEDIFDKRVREEYSRLDPTNYYAEFKYLTEYSHSTSSNNTPQLENIPNRKITEDLSFSDFHKKHKTPFPSLSTTGDSFDNEMMETCTEVIEDVKSPLHEVHTIHDILHCKEPHSLNLFDNSNLDQVTYKDDDKTPRDEIQTIHQNIYNKEPHKMELFDCSKLASETYKVVADERTPSYEVQTIHENIHTKETDTFNLFDNLKLALKTSGESILADPINFFSTNETSTIIKPVETESETGSNRLASYFSTPPKNDSTKSFFELSQSQNHYRENNKIANVNTTNQGLFEYNQMSTKSFFELGQSQNHYKDNRQLESLKLMKDLTSCKNFTPHKDDVVKTVNYFVVEYNNIKNVKNDCISDNIVQKNNAKLDRVNSKTIVDEVNKDLLVKIEETLLNKKNIPIDSKYCSNMIGDISKEDCKFRKTMDTETKSGGTIKGESSNFPVVHIGGTKKKGFNVNFDEALSDVEEKTPEAEENRGSTEYAPVKHHWFYRVDTEGKSAWLGFSVADSKALEEAFLNPELNDATVIPTDGGRFDVNVIGRLRVAVYWTEKPTNVRRCSWFYKGSDVGYVPYTESVAELLEDEYRNGVTTGVWHRRITLPNNEAVVMHSSSVMVHFPPYSTDTWGGGAFRKRVRRNPPTMRVTQDQTHKIDHLVFVVHGAGEWKNQKHKNSALRPLMVTRGYDEAIQEEQPSHIDHLLMFCHGVGPVCDMSFRSVEQVVNDFRSTSLKLTQSHYKNSCDSGTIGRVEMLPISWHSTLHSGENGVDSRLAQITLESIPKLRNFTNDTILDVLFYTSPTYSQTIIDAVCKELNRIYSLFKQRNPTFTGGISLAGHSLGSVILYDLLCNQHSDSNPGPSQKTYVQSSSCAVQPNVKYPHLDFTPDALYALGSPIAIFEFIRGVESIGEQFSLPTCPSFFNIFHPYDPIAYRVEPLINPELKSVQPYLIPHHKGRKRMHLELKETMARVSADIKQKLLEVVKASWYSMWRTQPPTTQQLEKVVEEVEKEKLMECKEDTQPEIDSVKEKMLGQLNQGRRIDYVLQEAPIEMFNEYIFAIRSHVCYWESEDVMLLMLREIYLSLGVQPDSSLPQQSMTVERTKTPSGNEDPNNIPTISEVPTTSRKAD